MTYRYFLLFVQYNGFNTGPPKGISPFRWQAMTSRYAQDQQLWPEFIDQFKNKQTDPFSW